MNWWLFGIAMVLFSPAILVILSILAVVLSDQWEKNRDRVLVTAGFVSSLAGCVVMAFAVPQ